MSEYVSVTMRIDKDLKLEAQRLFSELGLDMTTAYNMFLVQAVRTQSIPFEIALGNGGRIRGGTRIDGGRIEESVSESDRSRPSTAKYGSADRRVI